jgi:hypothetical protein
MANDRNRTDGVEDATAPPQPDMNDEPIRGGAGDDVRGIADEDDDEFEDSDDLEDEDDSDGSM